MVYRVIIEKLFKLAFDGITQLSRFPLMVAAYVGCLSS